MVGWERIPGWEGLYIHRKRKLCINVYVDDFHLSGRREEVLEEFGNRAVLLGEADELGQPQHLDER